MAAAAWEKEAAAGKLAELAKVVVMEAVAMVAETVGMVAALAVPEVMAEPVAKEEVKVAVVRVVVQGAVKVVVEKVVAKAVAEAEDLVKQAPLAAARLL